MPYEPKTKPYAHQLEARDKARGRDGFGWLMEMGTGKTKTDIDETGELMENNDVQQNLILAPKGVYSNWTEREIPIHLPDGLLERSNIAMYEGGHTIAEREALLKCFQKDRPSWVAMNLEALGSTDRALEFAEAYCKNRPTKITIDESSRIKNPTAKVTLGAMRLGKFAAVRRVASGLPNPNSPLDMFSQLDFLQPGYMGANFFSFRYRFALLRKQKIGVAYDPKTKTMKDRFAQIPYAYQRQDELAERINKISFRAKKIDCLDLPPENFRIRLVELTSEQRRIYNELRSRAMADLGDTTLTATMIITRMMRLHQVVCGVTRGDDGSVVRIPNNRTKALMEELEELGDRPAIVWCNYRTNILDVTEELRRWKGPKAAVEYHGGLTREQGDHSIDMFQKHGEAQYFVANQAKGGFGITLTRAAHDFFYSNNESLEQRLQAEARTHRSGQLWPVTHTDFCSPGTVEEKILQALRKKIDLSTVVLNDGPKKWII